MTREEAISRLQKMIVWEGGDDLTAINMALEALEQPEQKKGKWIESKDIIVRGTCSCCGWDAIADETDVVGMPFCPNCGARMGGEPNKGKWQWTDDGETGTYTCSECAYHAFGKAWEILNGVLQTCPNCGAKMEVEL